jgi:hypothetical protein
VFIAYARIRVRRWEGVVIAAAAVTGAEAAAAEAVVASVAHR